MWKQFDILYYYKKIIKNRIKLLLISFLYYKQKSFFKLFNIAFKDFNKFVFKVLIDLFSKVQ